MEEKFNTRRSHSYEDGPVLPERRSIPKLPIVVAGVMTFLAVIFGVLYFTKSADNCGTNSTQSDSNQPAAAEADQAKDQSKSVANTTFKLAALDRTKALIGDAENIYGAPSQSTLFGYSSYDGNTVTLSFCSEDLEYYYPDVVAPSCEDEQTITFSQGVIDVFTGGFGQSVGGEVVFFLLEDGTVEFMPLHDALLNDRYESYGKVEGVENVVRLTTVGVNYQNYIGGHVTTIAIRADGSFYDLADVSNEYLGY